MLTVAVACFRTDQLLKDEAHNIGRYFAEVDALNSTQASTPRIDAAVRIEDQIVGPIVCRRKQQRLVIATPVGGLLKEVIETPMRLNGRLDTGAEFQLREVRKPRPQRLVKDKAIRPDIDERSGRRIQRFAPFVRLAAPHLEFLAGHPLLQLHVKRLVGQRRFVKKLSQQHHWPVEVTFQRSQEDFIGW